MLSFPLHLMGTQLDKLEAYVKSNNISPRRIDVFYYGTIYVIFDLVSVVVLVPLAILHYMIVVPIYFVCFHKEKRE